MPGLRPRLEKTFSLNSSTSSSIRRPRSARRIRESPPIPSLGPSLTLRLPNSTFWGLGKLLFQASTFPPGTLYRCAQTFQTARPSLSVPVSQRTTNTSSPVTGSIALRSAFFTSASRSEVFRSRFTSSACTVHALPVVANHLDWMQRTAHRRWLIRKGPSGNLRRHKNKQQNQRDHHVVVQAAPG